MTDNINIAISCTSIALSCLTAMMEVCTTFRKVQIDNSHIRELRARKTCFIWGQSVCNIGLAFVALMQALQISEACQIHQHIVYVAGLSSLFISGGLCGQMKQWVQYQYRPIGSESSGISNRYIIITSLLIAALLYSDSLMAFLRVPNQECWMPDYINLFYFFAPFALFLIVWKVMDKCEKMARHNEPESNAVFREIDIGTSFYMFSFVLIWLLPFLRSLFSVLNISSPSISFAMAWLPSALPMQGILHSMIWFFVWFHFNLRR